MFGMFAGDAMDGRRDGGPDGGVLPIIRSVRRRWRARILLRGLAITGAGAFLALLVSAWGLEAMRFSAGAVAAFRWTAWGLVAGLALFFVVRPLLRRVTDEQVALYLEEHEPSLEASLLGAVEAERQLGATAGAGRTIAGSTGTGGGAAGAGGAHGAGPSASGRPGGAVASPELVRKLVERAVERARTVEYGRRIEQPGIMRYSGALAGLAVGAVLLAVLAPPELRHGFGAVLMPTVDAASVNPYAIVVEPGDATVARGSDLFVRARLVGFHSDEVALYARSAGETGPTRLSMIPRGPDVTDGRRVAPVAPDGSEGDEGAVGGDAGAAGAAAGAAGDAGDGPAAAAPTHELLLLSLQEDTEYFVEADGVRSGTFTLEVAELPYVDRMDHTYRFPAFTGLQERMVEDAGDVAAPEGTEVDVVIQPTIPAPAGRLVLEDGAAIELEAGPDGTLVGTLPVREPGYYRVLLARNTGDGEMVEASPRYTIDVLRDLRPTVQVTAPGRDAPVSALEEVFIEARADDDYGVEEMRLVYSVNGGPQDTVGIFRGSGQPLPDVTAGHTLFLEEFDLEDGDVVSYFVEARDADARPGAGSDWVSSDLYFLQIRPFRRDFRQAEQQGGGGAPMGGGGEAGPETALSELQRQVVVATFNILRDQEGYSDQQRTENLTSVALAQGRVREQVATLVMRMGNRGLASAEETFRNIAEMLPEALDDMERSEELLREGEPGDALEPQQQALRVLQKAEETYERFVGQQQQGGGGGGGGANAEDLADLFELELDRMRNQYETVQRGERQQADESVDEVMERLQELARRQQQELERQQARAAQNQARGGDGSGDSQRALADSTEEAARQLERLSRERNDPALQETARQLQEAAEAMRRSAARTGSTGGAAEAGSALDRLEEAERRLRRDRQERLGSGAEDALERARRLAENQERVQQEVEDLQDDPSARREQIERLDERKEAMRQEAEGLQRQLEELAGNARQEDPGTARELEEAADAVEESNLVAKIAWSRGVVRERDPEFAQRFEEEIAGDIENVERAIEEAVRSARGLAEDREAEESLERARDLVRSAESMGRRLDPNARQGEGEQAGEQGEQSGVPGEAGQQEGQAGEQGEGQQGQEGQQGGDQQGQQGQEGGDQQGDQQGRQGGDQQGEQGGQAGEEGARGGGPGDPGGDVRGGAARGDDLNPRGGATRGNPRPYTDEEIRQFERAFRQQLEEARELRRDLSQDGRDVDELDRAVEALERLADPTTYRDLPQVALLQEELRQSLRRVEFTLRREVEGEDRGRAVLQGSDEVPPGFRELVEEYFRSLARGGGE